MTVSGIVRRIEPYGVFVELAPNLCGLAERRDDLQVGDGVTVYVKAILPQRMKIKLVILDRQAGTVRRMLRGEDYRITGGHLDLWQYHPEACTEKQVMTRFDT